MFKIAAREFFFVWEIVLSKFEYVSKNKTKENNYTDSLSAPSLLLFTYSVQERRETQHLGV